MAKPIVEGVCGECQGTAPVRLLGYDPDRDEIDDVLDEPEGDYVVTEHRPFGTQVCPGTGTSPQAVFQS